MFPRVTEGVKLKEIHFLCTNMYTLSVLISPLFANVTEQKAGGKSGQGTG